MKNSKKFSLIITFNYILNLSFFFPDLEIMLIYSLLCHFHKSNTYTVVCVCVYMYTAGQLLRMDHKLQCSVTLSEIWGLVG